jgi:nucleotide-binding universal stress UspA family protein
MVGEQSDMKHAIIPLTGSPESEMGLKIARAFVEENRMRAALLHVIDPASSQIDMEADPRVCAERYLAAVAATFAGPISVERHLLEGDPVEQILEFARASRVLRRSEPTLVRGRGDVRSGQRYRTNQQ